MRPFALVAGTVLLLAGCTLNTDYFSDYRGKNILGNYDFNAKNANGTAKWTTTTLGLITTAPTTDYYMGWAPASDLAGLGLSVGPDGSSVTYRLEIKNLIPDGDFENEGELALSSSLPASLTSIGWARNGTSIPQFRFSNAHLTNGQPSSLITFSPGRTVNNRSMLFASQASGDQLSLTLNTAIGSLWLPGTFQLRLDFVNAANSTVFGVYLVNGMGGAALSNTDADIGGEWTPPSNVTGASTPVTIQGLSHSFTVTATTDSRNLLLGGSTSSSLDAALIDNVRVLPSSIDLSATTSFPSLNSGALPLLPGTKSGAYVFTLMVRDDPTADQTGALIAHALNRFYPSGLTVTVRGKAKNSPGTRVLAQQFVPRPSAGWTTWTTLTLNGGLDFITADSDLAGSPALVVSLTPTNIIDSSTGGKDVGSLLVSQPNLTFNP